MTDRQAGLPGCSAVKNSPANAGDMVQSLSREAPLEEETATHSVVLPAEPHGQRSLVRYSLQGRRESDTTEWLSTHASWAVLKFKTYALQKMYQEN